LTGLFLPWHRWYVYVHEESLKNRCGYTGVSPYWNWTIGGSSTFLFLELEFLMAAIDSSDFYESPFWKDSNPESGLGGWGDPNADFSVPDGGFNEFHLSYPSPHILRRNFTLRPFASPLLPPAFFPDPQKEANASFSASAIEPVIETPAGDYKGFQAAFETFEVKNMGMSDRRMYPDVTLGCTLQRTRDHGGVSCLVSRYASFLLILTWHLAI
jgi:tyrosinase